MNQVSAQGAAPAPDRLLRDRDVAEQLGIHRATVWDMAASVASFPKPVTLSAKITRWRQSEVQAYIRSLPSNS